MTTAEPSTPATIISMAESNTTPCKRLRDACSSGDEPMVRELLARHPELLDVPSVVTSDDESDTLLIAACRGNHFAVAMTLLDLGANMEETMKHGLTSLHVAASQGHERIVSELLRRGANVNAIDKDGWTALYGASLDGNRAIVELLLRHGADRNIADCDDWTSLRCAPSNNCVAVVRLLLKFRLDSDDAEDASDTIAVHASVDIDAVDSNGWTALYMAVWKNYASIVELLLQHGANAHIVTNRGKTLLHTATKHGYGDIVRLLLAHQLVAGDGRNASDTLQLPTLPSPHTRVSVDAVDNKGRTALHHASKFGDCTIVALLLQHGANANATQPDGMIPLHIATQFGHEDIVRLLLARQLDAAGSGNASDTKQRSPLPVPQTFVNIGAADNHGSTALHYASAFGKCMIVALLLQIGAKVTATSQGKLPLHDAAMRGHEDVVRLLVLHQSVVAETVALSGSSPCVTSSAHANVYVNAVNSNGLTAMHFASSLGHAKVVTLLAHLGANPNAKAANGQTPLCIAASCGFKDVVSALVAHGADVNSRRIYDDKTVLAVAVDMRRYDVAVELLARGADVNAVSVHESEAPLHIAAKTSDVVLVELLLQHGADVNSTTASGTSPLHYAAESGYVDVVRLLLANGAHVDAIDNAGVTPLQHASRRRYRGAVIAILLAAGACMNQIDGVSASDPVLCRAVTPGYMDTISMLLEHGANVNATTHERGDTALHIAPSAGFLNVVQVLLAHGADVDAINNRGETPMDAAVCNDSSDVGAALNAAGAGAGNT